MNQFDLFLFIFKRHFTQFVDFSGKRTRFVGVEVEYIGHLTTTPDPKNWSNLTQSSITLVTACRALYTLLEMGQPWPIFCSFLSRFIMLFRRWYQRRMGSAEYPDVDYTDHHHSSTDNNLFNSWQFARLEKMIAV